MTMMCFNFSDITIITVKNVYYCCIIHEISKHEAIHLLEKKSKKKIETKNILIDEKNYTNLTIYFTRYVYKNSRKILSLHYHELMGKIEKHEGKNYLMVDDYMLNKELDKIRKNNSHRKML